MKNLKTIIITAAVILTLGFVAPSTTKWIFGGEKAPARTVWSLDYQENYQLGLPYDTPNITQLPPVEAVIYTVPSDRYLIINNIQNQNSSGKTNIWARKKGHIVKKIDDMETMFLGDSGFVFEPDTELLLYGPNQRLKHLSGYLVDQPPTIFDFHDHTLPGFSSGTEGTVFSIPVDRSFVLTKVINTNSGFIDIREKYQGITITKQSYLNKYNEKYANTNLVFHPGSEVVVRGTSSYLSPSKLTFFGYYTY